MKLALALVPLAFLVACGGSRSRKSSGAELPNDETTVLTTTQPLLDRQPLRPDADTLYAEYVTTRKGERFERIPLSGEITCYGGPALDGSVAVELYVRRAVSRDVVIEDSVAILPDDLIPRRQIFSLTPGEGVSPVRDGLVVRGRALVADDEARRTVQLIEARDGAIVLLARDTAPASMRLVSYRLDPEIYAEEGVPIDLLDTPEAWSLAQGTLLEIAESAMTMSWKGELPVLAADECDEIFSHFPPPGAR